MAKPTTEKSKAGESRHAVRVAVLIGIALVAWGLALGEAMGVGGAKVFSRLDDFFYDAFYRMRPEADMRGAEVVLVAADQASLTAVDQRFKRGWPWPREFWGNIAAYVAKSGAKGMAYDITFPERSTFQNETGDDDTFGDLMNDVEGKIPVVFGASIGKDGTWGPFGPPVKHPVFGVVNLGEDKVYRWYPQWKGGQRSLALAMVQGVGLRGAASQAAGDASGTPAPQNTGGTPVLLTDPFLLHYYGPHKRANGEQTFRYVPAYAVLSAAIDGEKGEKANGVSADLFKGKIVILCAIAQGTFDLKTSPLSDEYPGPEVQATAMENLLRGERVHAVGLPVLAGVALICAVGVSVGVVLPRRASLKVAVPVVITAALLITGVMLFRGETIWWMSPVSGLSAIVVATPVAFGWTYFAEDRQRRFMLKALSKVVSPAVAEQLSREPERLALGTVRGEITVLFTDLANFTDMAEGMDVQHLGEMINRYLGEMSTEVFRQDGTLDKYIGDAVMCFWNAPLPQADHAARACRAALAMVAREKILLAEMAKDDPRGVTKRLFTRIGINTSAVAVGFIGSEHLFNYTALGDGVNLASRLEGANKIYGSQIILSENTAALVKGAFWLRKIDVLRVKGKKEPMAVFELMGERGGEGAAGGADRAAVLKERIEKYEAAFEAYEKRKWDEAERMLLEVSRRFGEDGPVMALLARVRDYRNDPPPEEWDGVYISSSK